MPVFLNFANASMRSFEPFGSLKASATSVNFLCFKVMWRVNCNCFKLQKGHGLAGFLYLESEIYLSILIHAML